MISCLYSKFAKKLIVVNRDSKVQYNPQILFLIVKNCIVANFF